mmetsp:Transcript_99452/g.309858  ORF Transcript_99452/g.309858 Transcript_99452/m.309858 type:complete len:249 (-) Transcript_99452:35-781(-)
MQGAAVLQPPQPGRQGLDAGGAADGRGGLQAAGRAHYQRRDLVGLVPLRAPPPAGGVGGEPGAAHRHPHGAHEDLEPRGLALLFPRDRGLRPTREISGLRGLRLHALRRRLRDGGDACVLRQGPALVAGSEELRGGAAAALRGIPPAALHARDKAVATGGHVLAVAGLPGPRRGGPCEAAAGGGEGAAQPRRRLRGRGHGPLRAAQRGSPPPDPGRGPGAHRPARGGSAARRRRRRDDVSRGGDELEL